MYIVFGMRTPTIAVYTLRFGMMSATAPLIAIAAFLVATLSRVRD